MPRTAQQIMIENIGFKFQPPCRPRRSRTAARRGAPAYRCSYG
jgi:hypothetical protein